MTASIDQLRAALRYDLATGKFIWRVRAGTRGMPNTEAGTINPEGYVAILYRRKRYLAHRLAWFFVHGRWPERKIDHIDGNPSNNSLTNLRECDDFHNAGNRKINKNNTTGFRGVVQKNTGKYEAYLAKKYLGRFDTAAEAGAAHEAHSRKRYDKFSYAHRGQS